MWHRIKALLWQEFYLTRRSLEVIMDVFFYSLLSVLLFGWLSTFLAQSMPFPARHYLLLGIVLWEVIRVAQYSLSVGAMWNVWSRNLSNLFIAPLSMAEYLGTAVLSATVKAVVVLTLVATIAAVAFGFSLAELGWANLALFTVNLLLFAFATGLIILGLIFQFGTRLQALAWGLIAIFQPLSAAFFPVAVLPQPLRAIAYALPPTYVFEAARAALSDPRVNWQLTGLALGLNAAYLLLSLAAFAWCLRRSQETGQFARNEQ